MGLLRKFERAKNAYIGHDINGIKHYNWHSEDKSWVGDFIRSRFAQKDWKKLSVVSVFGSPRTFWFHKNENKIFFTGIFRLIFVLFSNKYVYPMPKLKLSAYSFAFIYSSIFLVERGI